MGKPDEISKRQASILKHIIAEVEEKGYPPSVREIGEVVGLQSSSTVHNHLIQLEKKGYIKRDPTKPRAITILRHADGTLLETFAPESAPPEPDSGTEEVVALPLLGNVAAGAPILAEENIEDVITFPMRFIRANNAFLLKIRGESMIGVGICDGDYVIVAPTQTAYNGETVIALIDDEATCKTYYRERGRVRLQPENDEMEPIYATNPKILGKVIAVFRSLI